MASGADKENSSVQRLSRLKQAVTGAENNPGLRAVQGKSAQPSAGSFAKPVRKPLASVNTHRSSELPLKDIGTDIKKPTNKALAPREAASVGTGASTLAAVGKEKRVGLTARLAGVTNTAQRSAGVAPAVTGGKDDGASVKKVASSNDAKSSAADIKGVSKSTPGGPIPTPPFKDDDDIEQICFKLPDDEVDFDDLWPAKERPETYAEAFLRMPCCFPAPCSGAPRAFSDNVSLPSLSLNTSLVDVDDADPVSTACNSMLSAEELESVLPLPSLEDFDLCLV